MSASDQHFSTPLSLARPRGARLLQGHSPKLARPVLFTNRAAFAYWISLEADPAVLRFCERPAKALVLSQERVLDFWVQRDHGAQFVLMMPNEANNALPAMILGLPLNQSQLAERVAQEVWLLNWQRIIGIINAARSSLSTPLIRQVQRQISAPITLADIERGLSGVDIPMVRGAVFELLRTGRIRSPQLLSAGQYSASQGAMVLAGLLSQPTETTL